MSSHRPTQKPIRAVRRVRYPRAVSTPGAVAASLTACLLSTLAPATVAAQGLTEAFITHRGHEQIIAGPNVPGTLGLMTNPDYVAAGVALNAAGTRIWFVLFDWGANPEYQVWTLLTDGTGVQQIILTSDNWAASQTGLTNLFVSTNHDGSVAVLDSSEKFSRIELSDPLPVAAEPMFALDPFGSSSGNLRLSDDGTSALFLDEWNDRIVRVDLVSMSPSPVLVADKSAFSHMAQIARNLRGFDLTGNGNDFWVAAENFYNDVFRNRFWVTHGSGLPVPVLQQENLPEGDNLDIRQVEVSDDGSQLVYCPELHVTLNNPRHCFLQEAGSTQTIEILDGSHALGGAVLADGGQVVYLLSDAGLESSYGFRTRTDNPEWRAVAGTQRLSGRPNPDFRDIALSDDGRVLAAPTPNGVYVQHDGLDAPASFPRLENILSGYDALNDELVVQAVVSSLSMPAIERIYTLPLYRGIEPSRTLAEVDNPLFSERNGGGVNYSTTFVNVGGNVFERRIPMDGKIDLLSSDFSLRIVIVDDSGTRTAYYDFTPITLFGDGFESGDTTRWSATVP